VKRLKCAPDGIDRVAALTLRPAKGAAAAPVGDSGQAPLNKRTVENGAILATSLALKQAMPEMDGDFPGKDASIRRRRRVAGDDGPREP